MAVAIKLLISSPKVSFRKFRNLQNYGLKYPLTILKEQITCLYPNPMGTINNSADKQEILVYTIYYISF